MLADKKTNSFVYFAVFSLLIALSVFAIRTWGYRPPNAEVAASPNAGPNDRDVDVKDGADIV